MPKRTTSKTYCSLPWVHLATQVQGTASPCCITNHSGGRNLSRDYAGGDPNKPRLLRLGRESIREVLNSDYFRQTRRQLLSGEIPPACQVCFRREEAGHMSRRAHVRSWLPLSESEARERTSADGGIEPNLWYVELRLSNVCNLKCRTCGPASSSKWNSDRDALSKKLSFVTPFRDAEAPAWSDSPEFWKELDELTPRLLTLHINGGEPMLHLSHFDYLRKLIASGRAARIKLLYNTNATLVPEKGFEIWRHFESVRISASIDDLRERNHYIRYPADWDAIERTLDLYRDNGMAVDIQQTVSAMNVFYLDEFEDWARGRGLSVIHNFVHNPAFLAVDALPLKARQAIFAKISPALDHDRAKALSDLFGGPDDAEKFRRFREYTRALDELRGESFEKTFPELNALLS